ncbi:TonB-dependent receptor domain-containing protein [Sphingomonas sp.]|uniref:TonB-dependent receptor domain-containing protein n=1 Tax=Sphingomonas sp. TaxID=28214 RepID=UPI003D6CBDED
MSGIFGATGRRLMESTAVICVVAATPALAQTATFDVPVLPAGTGIATFARQADIQLLVSERDARGKRTNAVKGTLTIEQGLTRLLAGTGLSFRQNGPQTYVVTAGTIASDASEPVRDDPGPDIIVTAQKKEEKIQDVPIAISAFSRKSLDDHKIEGGSELLRAVPNVTFSKGNFSGYNFSIRGIGTKAVSASTDPAVAVSFNNTPLIRNRLFEQEFFDMERVEVLRGPQGTLYGRNATGGVVNLIPALPGHEFRGEMKGEVGNYKSRRLSGMLNIPLGDTLAVRIAGALTKRDGYDYNSFNKTRVNGRDLWSTRASVQWEPSDNFKANVIWQHFEEDDDRSRTGKQLCTRDPGPTQIGSAVIPPELSGRFSQGCKSASLYGDAAFGMPNNTHLPNIYFPASNLGLGTVFPPDGSVLPVNVIDLGVDPYKGLSQSRNLREISTSYDPVFRAKNDIFQLNLELRIQDGLKLVSQTAYARDRYYASQDYNRFASNPIFNASDAPGLLGSLGDQMIKGPTPGGIFYDPQLGPSNRLLAVDLSRSNNRQWTQEFRLQSSFDRPVNFNLGVNYLDFKSQDDYYVFNNTFTLLARYFYNRFDTANNEIGTMPCVPNDPRGECIYVDENDIAHLNDRGHNYFLSRNLVRTKSWAGFGELYWNVTDTLKITTGARYTRDTKTATPVPSQLLLGNGVASGGRVNEGYPRAPDINQRWGKFTGRLVVDWKPRLSFTDDTLLYASFARGYKGGGSNPPRVDIDTAVVQLQPLPTTFKPEYVNAFEIGTKNSFADGKLTLNATAFYYDYKDYQISQIVDRISFNENFDAQSWGLEFETAWRPSRSFRLDANLGYLQTRIGKGAKSIDVMNRTQGNPDWIVVRPWVQVPSNCIAPKALVEEIVNKTTGQDAAFRAQILSAVCGGSARYGTFSPEVPSNLHWNDIFNTAPYNPLTDAPNGGRGFYADLEGKELPNSPHLTFNIGAQYTLFFGEWQATLRGDYYRQSSSYARVYNTDYDRLRAWDNANIALTIERPKSDLALQFYIKNLFNDTPITDAFTNSDDTGLSTNVFTLDPRIIGFSVTKRF